ncbi:MAG: FAD-binding protein [Gammaproteobacteria bacterium]|nr:FAD-binding protein [Gammaproteobacteria bacterium]NIM74435.1 FAD-binding protein [Gammaproteobacteria bacterium]NIO26206.1 FAD-binding protein [Gammaproteobacteria bacterium]NIO66820.1 FAD-binding protein [Gammaproteobacteria bacterium]NIP65972.1 FAD-binding protein [Gammaproteobacteria bacterium]
MNDSAISSDTLERLRAIVGPAGLVDEPAARAAYLNDWRDLFHGASPLVLRPASTAEVAAIVAVCNEARIGIVPQGGNTSLVGGSVPGAAGDEILLSLSRMNRVRHVDPINYTMTVEAGCILAEVQRAARDAGRMFPLSLAAEGSCQIGGNLSTNAGGTAVLRYGNARELVLGLEVVLANGSVWNGLRGLRKDNTGYDLKQLFLGAEGSLGVVTAAVLKLFPAPTDTATAMVAMPSVEAAPMLLAALREASGDAVSTFEYMHRACLDILEAHTDLGDPFDARYEHYALVELTSSRPDAGLGALMETALAHAFEQGIAVDAVIASSGAQAERLWRMRETLPEAQKNLGAGIKHDVSVPLSKVPEFIVRATEYCERTVEGVRVVAFGHIGDGNVHFNVMQPVGADVTTFISRGGEITSRVHDIAAELDGSFSAEHGIGVLKIHELERYKSPVELDLMRALKRTLDPNNIMNPGKVINQS